MSCFLDCRNSNSRSILYDCSSSFWLNILVSNFHVNQQWCHQIVDMNILKIQEHEKEMSRYIKYFILWHAVLSWTKSELLYTEHYMKNTRQRIQLYFLIRSFIISAKTSRVVKIPRVYDFLILVWFPNRIIPDIFISSRKLQ